MVEREKKVEEGWARSERREERERDKSSSSISWAKGMRGGVRRWSGGGGEKRQKD